MQEYSDLQNKTASKREQLTALTQRKPKVITRLSALKRDVKLAEQVAASEQEHAQQVRTGITAGSKLLGGLRKVYQESREHGTTDRSFELNLGDIKLVQSGQGSLSAKEIKLIINEFSQNTDGSLTLELDECSASSVVANDTPLGAVKLTGIRLTVDPPLSQQLHEVMTCGFHKLPGKLSAMAKQYEEQQWDSGYSLDKTLKSMGLRELKASSIEVGGKAVSQQTEGVDQLMELLESLIPGLVPGSVAPQSK